jgi:hypothetical protein
MAFDMFEEDGGHQGLQCGHNLHFDVHLGVKETPWQSALECLGSCYPFEQAFAVTVQFEGERRITSNIKEP